ncbi:hypothetical protein GOP47_0025100 [Adiantum capillus-veneris]|uniref:Carbohydrate-binding-like fold protein n=1 Tax=Adiantum capillus-veneris TaxID=13818 RepID=A0A9D4U3I0_ADICA|nr:hypothetical protein GOP47_0025100 [Adiantum capillus-veneris]
MASPAERDGLRTRYSLLFFLLVLSSSRLLAVAETIHGCGGFVEASPDLAKARKPSDPKPDYSHIIVELQTFDGLVKDRVQCAPNGYYFLPVYDKGTFSLRVKGPPGWSWSPQQVSVVVDQQGCNNNEDINFLYTGFSVSGKVVGAVGGPSCAAHIGNGPSNVKVSMKAVSNSEILHHSASALTSPKGDFKFENVIPGMYQLQADHPMLKVQVKGEADVEVGFGNVDIGELFLVPGYKVEGSVVSQGNPVLGVHVYLFSDDVTEVPCSCDSGSSSSHGEALCHVVSDKNGKFAFSSLPCGKYKLVPFYKGENTVFDVSPASIEVDVSHTNMILTEPFKVTGFSVGGRVADSQGEGIEGVEILINDLLKAVTDINGFYKLDQVTSSKYTVKAQKPHYQFTTLENFMVLPNIASLPEIVASKYDLCGSILVDSSTHPGKRQVALTHGPANVKAQTRWVDEQGWFCFEVPPGEYRLTPITSQAERSSGLVFSPEYLDVLVTKPTFDVVLTQAKLKVSGLVNCIGNCDSKVFVSLIPYVHGTKSLDLSRIQKTSLVSGSNNFEFHKVLPGKYQVTVRHEPSKQVPRLNDGWCWEETSFEQDVGIRDLTNVQFTQKGYLMSVHSTHSAEATLEHPNGEMTAIQVKKGWQKVCLEQPGTHKLRILKSCTSFGLFPFEFDTSKPAPLQLIGQKYLLRGKIAIQNAADIDKEQLIRIVIVVWREDGSFADSNNRLKLATDADGTVLEYEHWAEMDERLTFIPKDTLHTVSYVEPNANHPSAKQFLFYPKEHRVHVAHDGCQPDISLFVGRPGMYIEGRVTPPLEGVSISIMVDDNSIDSSVNRGELAATLLTDKDGSYVAGPLYDDVKYVVKAAKEGYHCKLTGSQSFACQKLGQIIVRILRGEGAEDQLPSILLSLSGDGGFRRNAIASSREAFVFDGLFPGNFFLRPLLKEYSFSPASLAIDLESGSEAEASFSASRISFSVHGTVRSLTRRPEEGISLEARSESKGYYEETVTDSEGKYRLRGLQPETVYIIKVVLKEGLSLIERASPSSYTLEVGANDTTAMDFVVFHQPQVTIITGTAEGSGLLKWQLYLRVRVVSTGDDSKNERTIPLPLSHFFEIQGLPSGKYSLQLVLSLPEKTHRFESEPVEVDLKQNPQIHVGPLRFSVQEQHQKQELASAPVMPILVGLLVISVAMSTPKLLKEGQQRVWGSTLSSAASAVQLKKDVRRPVLRKRTY